MTKKVLNHLVHIDGHWHLQSNLAQGEKETKIFSRPNLRADIFSIRNLNLIFMVKSGEHFI